MTLDQEEINRIFRRGYAMKERIEFYRTETLRLDAEGRQLEGDKMREKWEAAARRRMDLTDEAQQLLNQLRSLEET
jgi:hypothetical protein